MQTIFFSHIKISLVPIQLHCLMLSDNCYINHLIYSRENKSAIGRSVFAEHGGAEQFGQCWKMQVVKKGNSKRHTQMLLKKNNNVYASYIWSLLASLFTKSSFFCFLLDLLL